MTDPTLWSKQTPSPHCRVPRPVVLVFVSSIFPWVLPRSHVSPSCNYVSPDKHRPDCILGHSQSGDPDWGLSPHPSPAAEVKSNASSLELFGQSIIKYHMIKYQRASPDPCTDCGGFQQVRGSWSPTIHLWFFLWSSLASACMCYMPVATPV